MFKRIFVATTIALLLMACALVPTLATLPTGQQAPAFTLNDLSGSPHSLTDYRGKVVVIDFFGYMCGYCQDDAKNTLEGTIQPIIAITGTLITQQHPNQIQGIPLVNFEKNGSSLIDQIAHLVAPND